jgi:hypothetical protein
MNERDNPLDIYKFIGAWFETSSMVADDVHPVCADCGERLTLINGVFICDNQHINIEEDGFIYAFRS